MVSQTCNLYNPSFEKVPVFEVVGASLVERCDPSKVKGDDPRAIHVQAISGECTIALDVDIQRRRWFSRESLADLPQSEYCVKDASRDESPMKDQWLDNLAGWLARSYTRVALPDEFNAALAKSKLRTVLEDKLAKEKESLFGIYLSIEHDGDEPWRGTLGLMPPPYVLGISLLIHEDRSPSDIRTKLIKQIFEDEQKDPLDATRKVVRAQLAEREGIRIIREGIEVRSVTDITLQEVRGLIRYSMVDHLSDSSFASQ